MAKFLLLLVVMLLAWCPAYAAGTIYLTFDDGPLPGTSTVLDVLSAETVPATMFMVGVHAEAGADRRALVDRVRGMKLLTLGNHSYSHANGHYRLFYSKVEDLIADLAKADRALGLHAKPVPARLPGRNVFRLLNLSADDPYLERDEDEREEVGFEFVAATGYALYGWHHEWAHDSTGKPVQSLVTLLKEIDHLMQYRRSRGSDGLILLMHDQMFTPKLNGEANLTDLIRGLKKRGYRSGRLADFAG